jgi:uncharacterized protein YkwD
MRRVVVALAVCALPACGMFAPSGSGGGGNGGGGGAGSGGGGSGGSGGGTTASDAHAQHNVDVLNMYRAQAGVAPLAYDATLSMFSTTASSMLEATGQAHGYFVSQGQSGALWSQGFCGTAAENQAPGWPISSYGDEDATIDAILKAMMDEGPGGGHHDNILAASSTRVGIGLIVDDQQQLWFTNDFSGPCQ